jgi:hypothetical protein
MSDVRKIERDLLAEMAARNISLTNLKKRQAKQAARDQALADRATELILDGGAGDIDAVMRLKQSAKASRDELLGSAPEQAVSGFEIELVTTDASAARLRSENDHLKAELAALKAAMPPRNGRRV